MPYKARLVIVTLSNANQSKAVILAPGVTTSQCISAQLQFSNWMTLKFLYSIFNTCKSHLKKGTSCISLFLCYFDRNVSVEYKWDHGWSTGSLFPPFQVYSCDSRHIKFAHKWICASVSKHTVILQPRYQTNWITVLNILPLIMNSAEFVDSLPHVVSKHCVKRREF